MVAVAEVDVIDVDIPRPPKWALIVGGIAWLIISLVLLSMDSTSAVTISYLVGFILLMAGVDEFVMMVVAPGWKWAHGLLGALFVLGGLGALFNPYNTFGVLTLFVGWYLLIKGSFDMAMAIGLRHELPLWGLMLALGIGEIVIGLWALGYPGRSAWLLILWVGVGTMLRGIGDLVTAFTIGASE